MTNFWHFQAPSLIRLTKEHLKKRYGTHCGVGTANLEFLVSMAYETLRPMFYFPEFQDHFLRLTQIRNYYDHPDPTYRSPLILRLPNGKELDGQPPIKLRPDLDDGHQDILLDNAARLIIVLHYVLQSIIQKYFSPQNK